VTGCGEDLEGREYHNTNKQLRAEKGGVYRGVVENGGLPHRLARMMSRVFERCNNDASVSACARHRNPNEGVVAIKRTVGGNSEGDEAGTIDEV